MGSTRSLSVLVAAVVVFVLVSSPSPTCWAQAAQNVSTGATPKVGQEELELAYLERHKGPFPARPNASECEQFWRTLNATVANWSLPTVDNWLRLGQVMRQRPAPSQQPRAALMEFVDQCASQRVFREAAPQRLILSALPALHPIQLNVVGNLTSSDQKQQQQQQGGLEDILADIDRLKARLVGANKQVELCGCHHQQQQQPPTQEPNKVPEPAGQPLARFNELLEEREQCRAELATAKGRQRQDEDELVFKLSEKEMELDHCRKQSARRLEIIKQATRMVDEMSKDMKERGIIS